MPEKISLLGDLISNTEALDSRAWLYLKRQKPWSLDSPAVVLVSDEVAPEEEDLPDAGIPAFARENGFSQVLPVAVIQEVVANARGQRPSVSKSELLSALRHYYDHDAFIVLS